MCDGLARSLPVGLARGPAPTQCIRRSILKDGCCGESFFLPCCMAVWKILCTFVAANQNDAMTMEFKIRANFVFSKDYTIEAGDLGEAIDKVQAMVNEGVTRKELTLSNVNFELLSHAVGGEGLEEIKPKG